MFADILDKKLKFFNELPEIAHEFSKQSLSVYDEQFKSLLAKLDECADFMSKNVWYTLCF